MKKEELFEILENIDDSYIKNAKEDLTKQKKSIKFKPYAIASCLGLVIIGSIYAVSSGAFFPENTILEDTSTTTDTTGTDTATTDDSTVDTVAYGFTMENSNIIYFPISFEDRIRFGLVPEDAVGLTKENTYQITENDLGEVMGTVANCGDENLIGCMVYHFATFPEKDAICIVDKNGSYQFYTSDGITLSDEIGANFDRVLEAYQMPDMVTEIEIQNGNWETLLTITDKEEIAAICTLLSNKENIGLQANEERYAKLWYDTYGNTDVYYDGEIMHYSDSSSANFDETYEKAHELWGANQRVIYFTTKQGFRFYALYSPSILTFECYGFYGMSENEAEQMNQLIGIAE